MTVQVTREQALDRAAKILIAGVALQASRTPRAAAEAAWYPGHRLGSVEAIEAVIIQRRKEDAELIARRNAAKQRRAA
jgi:hypothetical protein